MTPRPKARKMGESKKHTLRQSPNTDIAKRAKEELKQPTSQQILTASSCKDPQNKSPQLSRIKEKNSLISLNNRLAAILERNHQLELENSQLSIQVEIAEETLKVTKKTINESIGRENEQIKKQLLDSENEMAEIALNADNFKNALDDANGSLQRVQSELIDMKKELCKFGDKIGATNLELGKHRFEKAQLTALGKSLEADIKKLSDENSILKDESETFSLKNTALKSHLKAKSLELANKLEAYQQEVTALRRSNQKQIEKVGEKLKKDYESNMQKVIKSLRAECEQQISANKLEEETLFSDKETEMLKENKILSQTLRLKIDGLQQAEKTIFTIRKKVTCLEKQADFLGAQLKAHEEALKLEGETARVGTEKLEKQLEIVMDDKIQVINDYNDLMETKVALDNEIATYRKLLEGEDERLNVSIEARRNSRKRHWYST